MSPQDPEINPVWKTVAVALFTFILGAAIPFWVTQKNTLTREDLVPIQRQLDDHNDQLSDIKNKINAIEVGQGRISERLGIGEQNDPESPTPKKNHIR